jgi:alkanesulfonate monooxygenase SsuD/methylene tetrahydromethanopterin reductase-like flavin-dependent oxidoreductase (luciferase family)
MQVGFSLDPAQGLSDADELRLVRLGAELGYRSAWTPSGPDGAAFERCPRWYRESGLPTGISVVPASGRPAAFYAEQARRVWEETGGSFVLGVGSGGLRPAAPAMRRYMAELRSLLPEGPPVWVAALGPLMLRVAAELADGVALNWCSAAHVAWSREVVERTARAADRPVPVVASYIRTAVDGDRGLARRTLGTAARRYALGVGAYRRHFERMGLSEELARLEAAPEAEPGDEFLAAAGAAGAPGEVRPQFDRLGRRLDVAIVRVLVTRPGDAESARQVLEECRPAT